jgi:hypothetical protein
MKQFLLTMAGAACIALLSSAAWAQEDELKAYPGYVDFGQLSSIFGEPTVEIAVGKGLLGLVSAFTASEDPDIASIFSRLDGVRVRVFETEGLAEGAIDLVKSVSSQLTSSGWESVVSVNSADEQVRIFMKMNQDVVEGITVMAVEEDEAAFINVIGFLDPQELTRVMDHFDVEVGGVKMRKNADE